MTLTFQNVAVEAGGEGADLEAPAADAPQDRVHRGEDAHQLAGQLSSQAFNIIVITNRLVTVGSGKTEIKISKSNFPASNLIIKAFSLKKSISKRESPFYIIQTLSLN